MKKFFTELLNRIKEYLTFTQSDKKASIFLLLIIFAITAGIVIINFLPHGETDFSKFKSEIASLQYSSAIADSTFAYKPVKTITDSLANVIAKPIAEISFFKFNPNNLPDSLWIKLGLKEKQIRVIKNYESKGGHFYKKEDLKKMYCITPAYYATIEPYIIIENNYKKAFPEKSGSRSDTIFKKFEKSALLVEPIDLNIATEEQLDAVPGIGKYFASSIIKYRTYLGGYYNKNQLLEVWHYSDSLFTVTEKYFTTNPVYIHQKNINSDDKKELRHPYITYDLIDKIFVYRKVHGAIMTFDQLKKAMQIDDATLEKIKPYVKFSK